MHFLCADDFLFVNKQSEELHLKGGLTIVSYHTSIKVSAIVMHQD